MASSSRTRNNSNPSPSGDLSGGGMESLIPVFQEVSDLLKTRYKGRKKKIMFPEIVAIGATSSGKTSLLESVVGQQFLPRGPGIVTRCALELQLVNMPPGSGMWCEFAHIPKVKFTDFHKVENEIRKQTKNLTGSDMEISSDSIKITFFSPKVLNLTIIDLPGFVKNPPKTQANNDITTQIEELAMKYISRETSIILAVVEGASDIVNAESINFAKRADPNQERTFIVVTKVDMCQDSERMLEALRGNVVEAKLGIIGVINRKPEDQDIPFEEVIQYEKSYFHGKYGPIAHKQGIRRLTMELNRILHKRIADSCGEVLDTIKERVETMSVDLAALGPNSNLTPDEKRQEMVDAIDEFSRAYQAQIDGQPRSQITDAVLTRGTQLSLIMESLLPAELNLITPFADMSDERTLVVMRNVMPTPGRIINPELALNHFIKNEVKKVAPLAVRIATLSFNEMVEMIHQCLPNHPRFPSLNGAIFAITYELLEENLTKAKEVISVYFKAKSASAITATTDIKEMFRDKLSQISPIDLGVLPVGFISKGNAENSKLRSLSNSQPFTPQGLGEFTEEQKKLCAEIKSLAGEIFKIVRAHAEDFIIQAIFGALIYETIDCVGRRLNMKLNTSEKINEHIQEPADVQAKRESLKEDIQKHKKALDLIEKVKRDAA